MIVLSPSKILKTPVDHSAEDLRGKYRMIVLSPNKILFCTLHVWYTSGQGPLFPLCNTGYICNAVLNDFSTLIVVCPKL